MTTYDLCWQCLGELPNFDHVNPGDTINVVERGPDCPRWELPGGCWSVE